MSLLVIQPIPVLLDPAPQEETIGVGRHPPGIEAKHETYARIWIDASVWVLQFHGY